MDSSKNIQNIRRRSSRFSNDSESDESCALEASVKRLLGEVEGKNAGRSIFHDFHSDVPKLRRSVVHRAVQSVVSSTPMPTDKRQKFCCTDSLNISPIMQDDEADQEENRKSDVDNDESEPEETAKNDIVNLFQVPEAPPIVISDSEDDLGYDSTQKERQKTNRYNTRSETRKNVVQENKENTSKDMGDRSKPSSSLMQNGTLQNSNLLNVKWPRKPSFTSKEGRKTPEAPSPAREANSSSKAIKYQEKVIRQNAIDEKSLEVQKVSEAKKTSKIPLPRTRSKSREKNNAAWTSNSSSVSEGAPPRPPPRKKRLQRKNLSFDEQHVNYRASRKRGSKHLETLRETTTYSSVNAAEKTFTETGTSPLSENAPVPYKSPRNKKGTFSNSETSQQGAGKKKEKTEKTLVDTGTSPLNFDVPEPCKGSPTKERTFADAGTSPLTFPPDERGETPKQPPVRLGTSSFDLTNAVERDDDGKQAHLERFIQSIRQKHLQLPTIKEHSVTKSTTGSKTDREVQTSAALETSIYSNIIRELENERSSPTCMLFKSLNRNDDPGGFTFDDDEGSESSFDIPPYGENRPWRAELDPSLFPRRSSVNLNFLANGGSSEQNKSKRRETKSKNLQRYTGTSQRVREGARSPSTHSEMFDLVPRNEASPPQSPGSVAVGGNSKNFTAEHSNKKEANTENINKNAVKSVLTVVLADICKTVRGDSTPKRKGTKSKKASQRATRESAKSPSTHTEMSDLVLRNEASAPESPGSIAEEIQRSLGGETSNKKEATAKNINKNIFKSPLGATITDDCNTIQEDYSEILAVPLESHTPVSNRAPLPAKKTPNSEKSKNISRNRSGSNSTSESPVPISVTRTQTAKVSTSKSSPVKAKASKAKKNKLDTDVIAPAAESSAEVTGLRRSGRERKPVVITGLGYLVTHSVRVFKYFNTGPPIPDNITMNTTSKPRTKKQETAKKKPKNTTTAKKHGRRSTNKRKSTAKRPSSKKSVKTVPNLTDDDEQGTTTITSASPKNRLESRGDFSQSETPTKRSRTTENEHSAKESGDKTFCSPRKVVFTDEEYNSDHFRSPISSPNGDFRLHPVEPEDFTATNKGLDKDSGRSTMLKSVTMEESNARIAKPSTSKISKNYKKKKNVLTTITKATSRSLNSSLTQEIAIGKEPDTDGGASRRSSVLRTIPVEGEYIDLPMNSGVASLKYVEVVPKFKLVKDNLMVSDSLKNVKDGGSMGWLRVPPGGQKAMHIARKFALFYSVHEGEGVVQVANKTTRIVRLSSFIIPLGVEYCIINASRENPLLLSFVKQSPQEM